MRLMKCNGLISLVMESSTCPIKGDKLHICNKIVKLYQKMFCEIFHFKSVSREYILVIFHLPYISSLGPDVSQGCWPKKMNYLSHCYHLAFSGLGRRDSLGACFPCSLFEE